MKKILPLLIVSFFVEKYSEAQNLVHNPSFEEYSGCPTSNSLLDSCLFWFNPTQQFASSDYYNQCANPSSIGVPYNGFWDFQEAHSGNGYVGIITYYHSVIPELREYIEVPLISALEPETCYRFSMHINLGNHSRITSDDIGAYFSDTAVSGITNYFPLPFAPQVNNPTGNIPDSLNWTLVEGEFTALGGESFLVIGNFKNDSLTSTALVGNLVNQVYILIDDVSLVRCDSLNSVQEISIMNNFNLYPNPATNQITVESVGSNQYAVSTIEITNSLGVTVYAKSVNQKSKTAEGESRFQWIINLKSFPSGIYFIKLYFGDGSMEVKKFVKE